MGLLVMPGYTKIFDAMLDSTVWDEDDGTRLLWVTMLLMVNRDGVVEASVPGLAKRARISVEKAETGLNRLLAPDKYSRTPDNEGRRIEPVKGGWRVLNYDLYRWKAGPMSAAERMRRYRQRKKATSLRGVTYRDKTVTSDNANVTSDEQLHIASAVSLSNTSGNCNTSPEREIYYVKRENDNKSQNKSRNKPKPKLTQLDIIRNSRTRPNLD